jgi:hypothetical protein
VAAGLQWLLRSLPSYAQWYRFWLFCSSVEDMLPITGRGGTELHERWNGNARAYLGITGPGFPKEYWERTRASDLHDYQLL